MYQYNVLLYINSSNDCHVYCQLEDGHTLFDYDVGLNEIVQILVKPVVSEKVSPRNSPKKKENGVPVNGISDVSCVYYTHHVMCIVLCCLPCTRINAVHGRKNVENLVMGVYRVS